jgi:hypothetical protein
MAVVNIVFIGLCSPFILAALGAKDKTQITTKFKTIFTTLIKPTTNFAEELFPNKPQKGGNNNNYKLIHLCLIQIYNIIGDIIEKIDYIQKTNQIIPITNICVNGQNVDGKKKHVKCVDKDYEKTENYQIIRIVFKKIDHKISALPTQTLQTLLEYNIDTTINEQEKGQTLTQLEAALEAASVQSGWV